MHHLVSAPEVCSVNSHPVAIRNPEAPEFRYPQEHDSADATHLADDACGRVSPSSLATSPPEFVASAGWDGHESASALVNDDDLLVMSSSSSSSSALGNYLDNFEPSNPWLFFDVFDVHRVSETCTRNLMLVCKLIPFNCSSSFVSSTPPQDDAGRAIEAGQKSFPFRVIKISVDRSGGASLGVSAHIKEDSLLLERINEGLVAAWNSTAGVDGRVETWDSVIQVNNVAGSGMQLLKEIQQSEKLTITTSTWYGAPYDFKPASFTVQDRPL